MSSAANQGGTQAGPSRTREPLRNPGLDIDQEMDNATVDDSADVPVDDGGPLAALYKYPDGHLHADVAMWCVMEATQEELDQRQCPNGPARLTCSITGLDTCGESEILAGQAFAITRTLEESGLPKIRKKYCVGHFTCIGRGMKGRGDQGRLVEKFGFIGGGTPEGFPGFSTLSTVGQAAFRRLMEDKPSLSSDSMYQKRPPRIDDAVMKSQIAIEAAYRENPPKYVAGTPDYMSNLRADPRKLLFKLLQALDTFNSKKLKEAAFERYAVGPGDIDHREVRVTKPKPSGTTKKPAPSQGTTLAVSNRAPVLPAIARPPSSAPSLLPHPMQPTNTKEKRKQSIGLSRDTEMTTAETPGGRSDDLGEEDFGDDLHLTPSELAGLEDATGLPSPDTTPDETEPPTKKHKGKSAEAGKSGSGTRGGRVGMSRE
ncbi:hypothetical protein P7C70_g4188, partial [Phenoliferia sp. Uapishka_3]